MLDNDRKYEITILNWDKYQREMKGGEKRRRHREWVAISSRIYSDPDFLRLTIEQRYLWVMLVCYAGAVGPVFKLSPSDARVLFKLRRSAVFLPLKNHGFIRLRAATNRTVHNKTNTNAQKKNATPEKQPANREDARFDDFWKAYPKKKDKKKALAVWKRDKLDSHADKILANLRARTDWKDIQFTPLPTTYLNGERWLDELESVAVRKPRKVEVPTEAELATDRRKADAELAAMVAKQ